MKEILILGPGCYRCEKLEKDVKEVAEEMGVEYEIFKVSDVKAISGFGVMQTPALIVNNELKASGKLLTKEQIKEILGD